MVGATFGSYRLLRLIGEGGMGAVYAAEHVLLGRSAAVKVLLPEHSSNQQIVTRFFNEARAATAIRHAGIVEIFDFGYAPDGTAYIAMALLDGESLGDRMKRGTIAAAPALAIARQIAGALAAAHDAGIVHRDLKPDNVFVVPDDEVVGGERIKLLDFGIAKLAQDGAAHAKTSTGAVLGTPTYMAPEQCRGVAIDHRVDLYALGCILFEMLTGRPPFVGEGVGNVLTGHIHVAPPPLRSMAPATSLELERLVAQLLAKAPTQRVQSARALIGEIDRIAPSVFERGQTGGHATRPSLHGAVAVTTLSSVAGFSSSAPRRTGIWLGLGGAAVAVVVAAIVMSGREQVDAPPPTVAEPTAEVAPRPEAPPAAAPPPAVLAPPPAAPTPPPVATTPPPVPTSIAIAVDSVPAGARVSVDGKRIGKTPYRGELPVTATYRLSVSLDGYVEQTVDVDGGAAIAQTLTLERKRQPARDLNKSKNPFD